MPREARKPNCHPKRKHCANGLCHSCWQKNYYATSDKAKEYAQRYYKEHKEKQLARQKERRPEITARNYGLTVEALLELRKQCLICGETEDIVVDHNHKTGKVRGGLCESCNHAIGHLRDNPQLCRRAADYLEAYDNISTGAICGAGNPVSRLQDVPRSTGDKQTPASLLDRKEGLVSTTTPSSSKTSNTKIDCTDSSWSAGTDWYDNSSWGV